jgi:hypothetical protein
LIVAPRDPAGHARDQERGAQRVPEEADRRVDRLQIEVRQGAMHQAIPFQSGRHAACGDRLLGDNAQVVLLPLHVVNPVVLGHCLSLSC